jgi:hypothetical protein
MSLYPQCQVLNVEELDAQIAKVENRLVLAQREAAERQAQLHALLEARRAQRAGLKVVTWRHRWDSPVYIEENP